MLFDEDFNLVEGSSGVKQVAPPPDELKTLATGDVVMEKSSFLYVYTSNETRQDVFIDTVFLTLSGTPELEETHYYPFGLTMSGISSKAPGRLENRYKYNEIEFGNKEFGNGSGLEIYEAEYRNLDPQIGRWWQVDPRPTDHISPYASMDLNPIKNSDFYGDTSVPYHDLPNTHRHHGLFQE